MSKELIELSLRGLFRSRMVWFEVVVIGLRDDGVVRRGFGLR